MSHGQKIYYNIITAVLFHVMFWYCTDYPVHIMGAGLPVAVKNSVFVALYCVFLICIVPESKALFSHNLFYPGGKSKTVTNFIKIIVLFAAQLAVDVLYVLISDKTGGMDIFLDAACTCIWYAVVVIVLKYRSKIRFGRKKILFSALFVFAALAFCAYRNCISFARYNMLCEKYLPSSQYALRQIKNLDFLCSLDQLLLSVVIGAVIVVLFAYTSKEYILEDALYDCIHDRWFMRKIPATVIFTVVLFWIFKIIAAVIVFFIPQYTVYEVHFYEGDSTNYIFDDSFDYDVNSIEVSRCSADKTVELQFENNVIKMTHSNNELQKNIDVIRFDTDKYVVWDNYSIVDGELVEEPDFKEYTVDNNVVYLYGNCAFCYVEDGSPKVIEFADIADFEENYIITEMCKKLLEEGNVTVFEYVYEYLLKYDKAFIEPYISRYSQNSFNENETIYIQVYEYNPGYIVDFASKIGCTDIYSTDTYRIVSATEKELGEIQERLGDIFAAQFSDYDCEKEEIYYKLFSYNRLNYVCPKYYEEISEYIDKPNFNHQNGAIAWCETVYDNDPGGFFGKVKVCQKDASGNILYDTLPDGELIGYNKFSGKFIDWLVEGIWNGKLDHESFFTFEDGSRLYYHNGFYYTPEEVTSLGGGIFHYIEIESVRELDGNKYEVSYVVMDEADLPAFYASSVIAVKENDNGFRFWSIFSIDIKST